MTSSVVDWSELPLVLKPEEARRIFPVGAAKIRALCTSGDIPSIRRGRNILIPRDSFRAWLEGPALLRGK